MARINVVFARSPCLISRAGLGQLHPKYFVLIVDQLQLNPKLTLRVLDTYKVGLAVLQRVGAAA